MKNSVLQKFSLNEAEKKMVSSIVDPLIEKYMSFLYKYFDKETFEDDVYYAFYNLVSEIKIYFFSITFEENESIFIDSENNLRKIDDIMNELKDIRPVIRATRGLLDIINSIFKIVDSFSELETKEFVSRIVNHVLVVDTVASFHFMSELKKAEEKLRGPLEVQFSNRPDIVEFKDLHNFDKLIEEFNNFMATEEYCVSPVSIQKIPKYVFLEPSYVALYELGKATNSLPDVMRKIVSPTDLVHVLYMVSYLDETLVKLMEHGFSFVDSTVIRMAMLETFYQELMSNNTFITNLIIVFEKEYELLIKNAEV